MLERCVFLNLFLFIIYFLFFAFVIVFLLNYFCVFFFFLCIQFCLFYRNLLMSICEYFCVMLLFFEKKQQIKNWKVNFIVVVIIGTAQQQKIIYFIAFNKLQTAVCCSSDSLLWNLNYYFMLCRCFNVSTYIFCLPNSNK